MGGIKLKNIKKILSWILIIAIVVLIPIFSYARNLPKFTFGSRLLYSGTYGTDVEELQAMLNKAGFDTGTVDGIFGKMTLNGVLDFQRSKNLVPDGIVGPKTYAALETVSWADPIVYSVKPGDNLYFIAKRHGTNVQNIIDANGLNDGDSLYVGQKILIPHPPVEVPQQLNNATNYQELKNNIQALISQYPGKYGVYFIDLNTGQTFEINGYDSFIAASTYKVPLNFYLYTLITDGKIDPNMKVQYTQADYEGGAGSIQADPVGSYYTIRELSRRSIEESDNIASNMIMRIVGRDNYIKFMEKLGAYVIPYSNNVTSPRDMSMYMKNLLDYVNAHPDTAGELMYYLKNTIYNDRISYPIPDGIEVAHKIGNLSNVVNDAAIVFHPTRPYILTVLANNVDGSDDSYAYTVIRQISKMVYDFQNR
ncbi:MULTISPECIES: serine hydrolase [Thermoanaerobacter]|jgi:beta-lactamase class A|uniref:Peptidoglycan-binding domain 1 protein n=2 Tax=Thermoanaerobacter TaxID=1754 RepID=B0KD45_THEP3|nr:Peptidoglycan-binding domain 1 protein [Thermoanaerobacter pseudethanolicus ATCC 33223]ADV79096.1 Peptidoglycan-binding domain 1 protein [Thermoanaerobacter brockii subsp. finnii Ako-1]HBW60219.1 LysM peptidoglycan-binding domain-containing protein [Thermoanaerobacter sp.]